MKKILNTKVKDMNAITLIALVITIVVLIILATVVVNLSLGDNGIFNRAREAKEQYQNAEGYEQTEIAKATNEIDGYVTNNRNYTEQEVNELLSNYQKKRSNTFINVPLNAIGSNNANTTEFTAPADGYYSIGTDLQANTVAYTNCWVVHYLSDKTTVVEQIETAGAYYSVHGGCFIYLKQGEYIKINQQKNVTVEFSRFWYAEGCVPNE